MRETEKRRVLAKYAEWKSDCRQRFPYALSKMSSHFHCKALTAVAFIFIDDELNHGVNNSENGQTHNRIRTRIVYSTKFRVDCYWLWLGRFFGIRQAHVLRSFSYMYVCIYVLGVWKVLIYYFTAKRTLWKAWNAHVRSMVRGAKNQPPPFYRNELHRCCCRHTKLSASCKWFYVII